MNTPPQAICTIVAKNYVAAARTLCRSFLKFHPGGKCFVLVVDDFEGYLRPKDEPFELVALSELGIPDPPSFCFKYNITELCTAVKAHFLDYLLRRRGIGRLLYLDPDIMVTNGLGGLFARLDTSDIVLTPHLDTDYPEDNLLPDDAYIMRAGAFNLGFVGVNDGENARAFLDWWAGKLSNKCFIDPAAGYFVDQKFVDLVPTLFDNYYIEKGVGYNAAYWNLHSRRLSSEGGGWTCNGGPLYFFHFSGYDPRQPDSLVTPKYMPADLCRHRLSERPDIRPLFSEYRDALFREGYEETRSWPYTFGHFKTGEPIPNELRVYYRSSPGAWGVYQNPFESEELKRTAVVMKMRQRKVLSPLVGFGMKCRNLLRAVGVV
jgi:hypothetical protein